MTGAKSFTKAVAVQQDYAKSLNNTTKNAKKASGQLAAFDEGLNTLNKDESGSEDIGEVLPVDMFEEVDIEGINFDDLIDTSKIEWLLTIFDNLKNTIAEIGNAWKEAWNTDGLGNNIMASFGGIGDSFKNFLVGLSASTLEWASGLDFTPLLTSFNRLLTALQPFVDLILGGLSWAYNNVLLPLGKWTIEEALPVTIDLLAAAIGIVVDVLKELQPVAQWMWDNLLQPVAQWLGDTFVHIMEEGRNLLESFWNDLMIPLIEWFKANILPVIQPILDAIVNSLHIVLGAVSSIIDNIIGILRGIIDFLGGVFTGDIDRILSGIKAIFSNAWNAIVTVIKTAITVIFEFVGAILNSLLNTIALIIDSIKKVIITGITYVKTNSINIWTSLKNGTISVFKGIWDGIKGIINTILGGIEKMANGVVDGVNTVIGALNGLSFDIPDWIPGMGGNSFGFSIPYMSTVSIPRLATGTVVPRQAGEFAAILGDNNREAEVVSPLSTIEQAMRNVLGELGSNNSGGDVYISANADLAALIRLLNLHIDKENNRVGKNYVKVVGGIA